MQINLTRGKTADTPMQVTFDRRPLLHLAVHTTGVYCQVFGYYVSVGVATEPAELTGELDAGRPEPLGPEPKLPEAKLPESKSSESKLTDGLGTVGLAGV